MNARIFLSVFSLVFLCFTSCSVDNATTEALPHPISGVWNLKNVSGTIAGVNIDYTLGQVQWDFSTTSNSLDITKNIATTGPEDVYGGRETGTYTYEIQLNDASQVLYIDGIEIGVIAFGNNVLEISTGPDVADGVTYRYER